MKVKNNYNECLTNLACSIRKYFDLDYKHNTLKYIDRILKEYKPKNVVTILCDGMGSNIMDRMLDGNSFLIQNRLKKITTVFPATTVAATTSMLTGLNPVETGMLGWDMYYKDIDKTITVFTNSLKGEETELKEAKEYNDKHMIRKTISKEINENNKYKGYNLFPFGDKAYSTIDEMYEKIEKLCFEDGKKYIYAYDTEPDSTMHKIGCDKQEIKEIIEDRNNRIEELSNKLTDTIIFVVADHGHINVENIHLTDYPDIEECLLRNTSIEPRAVNFFIKPDKKDTFKEAFNKYFSKDFDLYDKEDVIESKLFGDGEENEIFRDALGDYLAIAKTNKTIIYNGNSELKSQHAGYTDDEIYVPLIVIKTDKKEFKINYFAIGFMLIAFSLIILVTFLNTTYSISQLGGYLATLAVLTLFSVIGIICIIIGLTKSLKDKKTKKKGKECYAIVREHEETDTGTTTSTGNKKEYKAILEFINPETNEIDDIEEIIGLYPNKYPVDSYLLCKYYKGDITIEKVLKEDEVPENIKKELFKKTVEEEIDVNNLLI